MIRLATKKDEGLIKQIHKESNKEIGSFNLFKCWEDYLQRKTPYVYYVIEERAFMRYGFSKRLKCYTIKEIGVKKEYQGQGLAEQLFKKTKSPLYLTCNEDNERGNRFYKKMGMRLKGKKPTKNKLKIMNIWVK